MTKKKEVPVKNSEDKPDSIFYAYGIEMKKGKAIFQKIKVVNGKIDSIEKSEPTSRAIAIENLKISMSRELVR